MPQSNRIILTDVDGVLLEWENHFTRWMVSCGYKLKENFKSEYDMQKRFADHNIDIKIKIVIPIEYNSEFEEINFQS